MQNTPNTNNFSNSVKLNRSCRKSNMCRSRICRRRRSRLSKTQFIRSRGCALQIGSTKCCPAVPTRSRMRRTRRPSSRKLSSKRRSSKVWRLIASLHPAVAAADLAHQQRSHAGVAPSPAEPAAERRASDLPQGLRKVEAAARQPVLNPGENFIIMRQTPRSDPHFLTIGHSGFCIV